MNEGIIFPSGMRKGRVQDDRVIMIYEPLLKTYRSDKKSLDPSVVTVLDIRNYITGNISIGNSGFITGDELAEYIEKKLITKDPSLVGHVAVFSSTGGLESGGVFEEFENGFKSKYNENTTTDR